MGKKKNKTTIDPIDYNIKMKEGEAKIPTTTPTPPKHYPIESLQMQEGTIIEVKEVLEVFTDAYRIVTPYNKVRLVFFHAIAYVDNGEYENE